MQTITAQLDAAFRAAIHAAFGLDDIDPLISVAQNEKFGDYQSNAAMPLAKQVAQKTGQKANPRAIAEQIKAKLDLADMARPEDVTIAGPGFLNVRLRPHWLAEQLHQAEADPRLGLATASNPQTVVVDYSGPNIAKEMHVGHLRSTIIGDSIARTLQFLGHNVIRQNHIGDWGLQMGMVTYAAENSPELKELTLGSLEALYRQINKKCEQDPAGRKQMIEETRRLQQTPKDQLTIWQQVRKLTLESAQGIYSRLGVTLRPEDVRGESNYSDDYGPMIEELKARGEAVETQGAIGIFPPGFTNQDGDPRPFIIQSRDGTYQYPTFDLAALRFRIKHLKADRIIYTHDSRQAEHFAMLFAVAQKVSYAQMPGDGMAELEFATFGTVLGEDNKPLKTRTGENVKLAELVAEAELRALDVVDEKAKERGIQLTEEQRRTIAHAVGIGAVKYADLSKDRISDYVFAWDRMLALTGNTAPYLQYAHARICSIFRKSGTTEEQAARAPITVESPFEIALAKHILLFGDIVALVARELKPHHLCNYLYELSAKFSGFYENCPVIQSPEPLRSSRLAICHVTARTLATGLDLLGIEHPEQM
jgi:arginyl-tRNA synthetase